MVVESWLKRCELCSRLPATTVSLSGKYVKPYLTRRGFELLVYYINAKACCSIFPEDKFGQC